MNPKRCHVRLTEKAHNLLAKKAEDSGSSMKEIASAAILLMFKHKRDNRQHELYTFILGLIAGGIIMFVAMGAML